MKRIFLSIVATACLTQPLSASDELKDPRTRDDDISGTEVNVEVQLLPSGFYEYIYTLFAPETNKQVVVDFLIDISCDNTAGDFTFPEAPASVQWDYASGDGRHSPVQIYPSPTGSAWMMIGIRNWVSFAVNMQPGERHTGFRILSPYPPGDRHFQLRQRWTTGDYDYEGLTDEEWGQLPIRDDFWVNGMTRAPGCSPNPPSPSLFAGSGDEPDNDLIQFAAPLRSAFHADDDTIVFIVHYDESLDPETFKVQPGWAKQYFSPLPGNHAEVQIKLHPGVNRIRLYGERRHEHASEDHLLEPFDSDRFVIRRSPPGKKKGKDNDMPREDRR